MRTDRVTREGEKIMGQPEEHPDCPFCPKNGKVKILKETTRAYLVQVVTNGKPVEDRYLIIPKDHVTLFGMPDDWMYHLKILLEDLSVITGMPIDNLTLGTNIGEGGGARVLTHLHEWIIFRTEPEGSASKNLGTSALITKVNEQDAEIKRLNQQLRDERKQASAQFAAYR